jgi:probable F420-dependent oxidoreductase
MKFGVMVPNWAPLNQELMIQIGLEAEALGFDHLFYTDHLMNPHVESDGFPDLTVEAWSLVSYMGARTTRIRIGTGVSPIGLRSPAMLAKQVATVDNLLDGRLDLGLGTGWAPGSFGLLGMELGSPKERLERFGEGVDLMRQLWTQDVVNFEGKYFVARDAVVAPKPKQSPYPPLFIGGYGPRMLEYTAQFGDGWIPWHRNVDQYVTCLEQIRRGESELNRLNPVVAGSVMLVVPDHLRDVPMDMGQGDPPNLVLSEIEDSVAAYERAGCELFVAFMFPADDALETLGRIAQRVQ